MKKIIFVINDVVTPTNYKLTTKDANSNNISWAFPPIKLSKEEANKCDQ
jgi:hypothetical protein